eukprot:TRINITY_DN721_c0_g1_i2.p1 TRINITY_DN721_c0_g1~~TRINITY_DN721_c0_g1_i2.p1  ORF type:complete len:177 (-),score=3.16 TRINITY_DN721_c0_g1_i2:40-525(-)
MENKGSTEGILPTHSGSQSYFRGILSTLRETPTSTYLSLGINLVCSIGIIFVNKLVFFHYKFPYGISLTALHFITTAIGMFICANLKLFEIKWIHFMSVLKLSLAFCLFVVLNNLSLQYNSVGFYQLLKTLTTPVIILIQWWYYNVSWFSFFFVSVIPTHY